MTGGYVKKVAGDIETAGGVLTDVGEEVPDQGVFTFEMNINKKRGK